MRIVEQIPSHNGIIFTAIIVRVAMGYTASGNMESSAFHSQPRAIATIGGTPCRAREEIELSHSSNDAMNRLSSQEDLKRGTEFGSSVA
jgi:hypothetical protein